MKRAEPAAPARAEQPPHSAGETTGPQPARVRSPAPNRIGVFGGTFDPPHNGHLRLAAHAARQLGLDKILWVVTADPPHKHGSPITPVAERLALVQASIADRPGFELSRVEIDRPGPHWAADTLKLLQEQNPGAELVYLMGGDSLRDLPHWGRPQSIVDCCALGVMRRPGAELDMASLEQELPGITSRVRFIDAPPINLAGQELRERVRAGRSIKRLVPAAVAKKIEERGLYR